ncbi:MAG TPA: cellulose synthase operon protein YhjQ/BcsQ [Longimicrobiaceae bacterium]
MSAQLEPLRRQIAPRVYPSRRGEADGAVVFASGKGGTGTSTLAALLAVGAAARGSRVLLVDGNVGFGSLHLYLGVGAGAGWAALKAGAPAEDLLVKVTETLTLLPAGSAEDAAAASISAAERAALFRKVSSLYAAYDLVVVDGGSRLDSVLAACGAGVGRLVAVSTPDRVSLAGTYALVKVLDGKLSGLPVSVVVNRGDETAAESLRGAARRFLARSVDCAGAVPDDECLRAGINAGMDIQDAAVDSPAAAAILEAGTHFVRGLRAGSAAGETLQLSRRS